MTRSSPGPVLPGRSFTASVFAAVAAAQVFFALLLIDWKPLFKRLTAEDGFVEYAGFLFLLLASGALAAAGREAWKRGRDQRARAIAFFAAAAVFFWAAGEEISWAQRILGIETPEPLARINGQRELNVHNINKGFFDRVMDRVTVLLAVVPAICHLRGRERLLGFRLPDVYLAIAFTSVAVYQRGGFFKPQFYHLALGLKAVIALAAARARRWGVVSAVLGAFFLTFLVVSIQRKLFLSFPKGNNSVSEIRETLFCLVCWAYAVTLWRDEKAAAAR